MTPTALALALATATSAFLPIAGQPNDNDLVRIYDVVIPYSDGLMATDELLREILCGTEFQKEMGTTELHYKIGKYAAEWERKH